MRLLLSLGNFAEETCDASPGSQVLASAGFGCWFSVRHYWVSTETSSLPSIKFCTSNSFKTPPLHSVYSWIFIKLIHSMLWQALGVMWGNSLSNCLSAAEILRLTKLKWIWPFTTEWCGLGGCCWWTLSYAVFLYNTKLSKPKWPSDISMEGVSFKWTPITVCKDIQQVNGKKKYLTELHLR